MGDVLMSAADETYARLMKAQRDTPPVDPVQREKDEQRRNLAARIRRKLPRVY